MKMVKDIFVNKAKFTYFYFLIKESDRVQNS